MAAKPPPWGLLISLDEHEAGLILAALYALRRQCADALNANDAEIAATGAAIDTLMRRVELYLKHDPVLAYARKRPPFPV